MSKAIKGNKVAVIIKRLLWEFNLYWKFMVWTKIMIRTTNLPLPPFHSSYSFFNCWKTTEPMTLKFSDFQFVFINCFLNLAPLPFLSSYNFFNCCKSLFLLTVFGKIKRNCISGLFCIANLLEVSKKKNFF